MNWYEATQIESPPRPRLNFDLDVDVCVVGAGLAGLTAAREIAQRGWSVAVLEAHRIGWAASGRNGGFVLPGFSEDIEAMIERIGFDHARELWTLSEAGVDYVRQTIAETGMAGIHPADGWLNVSKRNNPRVLESQAERLRSVGAEVETWSTERVRAVLPSARYFGGVHFPRGFHIHPLNYTLGLAAAAKAAGARIFEDTPALTLDPAGVRKRVQTPLGRVRAAHVILAGNVHLGSLVPRLAATLLPVTTYVIVSEPIASLNEVVRYHGAVSDGERADNHYRVVDADNRAGARLQWSGRITVWEAEPRRFARGLARGIRRVFPQLGKIGIAHMWSGTLGRSVHRMPQIGEIQPGLWVASGFGGHGLNTTAMAGVLIARGVVDNDQTWRLFAPYELVWAGGRIGRAVAQAAYLGGLPGAAIGARWARFRERAVNRKTARQTARRQAAEERAKARALALAASKAPPAELSINAPVDEPVKPAVTPGEP
jgi:glycine/D-amino acid oxidase-like deaminating enzyme